MIELEQELVLLGLLKERPKHGYELKKEVKEISSLFAGLDSQSIYYPLKAMEKKDFLIKRASKLGKRPERLVYKLTPKGEARFKNLLTHSFLYFKKPQFSLDLCLFFLNHVKPKVARRRLRARMLILDKLSRELRQTVNSLEKNRKPFSLSHILRHNLEMVETEKRFLSNLITTLSS
jgi:DNA-binding PadR family transcriptional regulator